MTFRGTFEHALDAKHRLTVPAKFRAALANGVVLAASPETDSSTPRSLALWTPEEYDAYTEATLANLRPIDPKARELQRFFFNFSHDTELDTAHRLMIPSTLMRYAGLEKDVVVAGSGRFIEVWDRARYEQYSEGVLTRISDIAASLGDTT